MSILLHDLSELEGAVGGGPYRSNLDLADAVLSGRAKGPLADFILNKMAFCFGDVERKALEELETIREKALSDLEGLLDSACTNIEENKGHCYRASSSKQALRIVEDLVGSGKIVFKSFSWTLEEIGVGEILRRSNQVLDTSVPLALAELRARGEVKDLLKGFDIEIGEDPVRDVEALYRRKMHDADVGITGVRVVAADPGAMVFLPYSGMDRLLSMAPEVHIIVAGIEEVVPTYADAFAVSEFIYRYGKGYYSFMGFVGGPSKTGDIEKRVTYGAHGPKEFHVIFLDDGRSEALKDGRLRTAITCLRASMLPCPETWPSWMEIIGRESENRGVDGVGRCPQPD